MALLEQLRAVTLTEYDYLLFISMVLAGVVLTSAVPCRTRMLHYSFEICGAFLGIVAAILLICSLPLWF